MKTYISVILDKSGSMESIRTDTIGGFNTFLEDQKKNLTGEVMFQLTQFDVFVRTGTIRPLEEVEPLTLQTYTPYGGTALLDAVGMTIEALGRVVKANDKAIVVVITDGEENSSKAFTNAMIRDSITHFQEGHDWTFMYLGANQDAWKVAQQWNFHRHHTMSWEGTPLGASTMFAAASTGATASASGGSVDLAELYKTAGGH